MTSKIHYSTNWMGPVSLDWYRNNGFTERRTVEFQGQKIEVDHITERWAGGRIDVYGTGEPYPQEISVPIMREKDWAELGKWLTDFETEQVLTLEELVSLYEKTNPKIQWWK